METVDKSVILTDSVVDELLDDWFERDADTFIKIRKSERLGWEKSLEKDSAYSAFILESPSQEELIKRAYGLARETIISMDLPNKVIIKITPEGMSCTDGKTIFLRTNMFDEKKMTVGEKLDVFLGVTIHEGCHVLYSDMDCLKGKIHPVVMNLFNIVEDERIEEECGDKNPGLANFLTKSKYYYFDLYYKEFVEPKLKVEPLKPFESIMNCILHIIRYPKYLNEIEIIKFGHYLLEIKKVVNPYPDTTEGCLNAAKRIFEIIKEFYVDIEKEKSESKKAAMSSGSDSGDDMKDSDSSSEGKSSSLTEEELSDAIERAMKAVESDSASMSSALSKIATSPTSSSTSDVYSSSTMAKVIAEDKTIGELCDGSLERGTEKDTFFIKCKNNKSSYEASLAKVKPLIPAIAKILKGNCREYKLIHHSMRSGVLDCNKLAEAFQGVPTVYSREGEVKTDKISVCVLIDESGSMGGSRISAARDTAILINEAIGSIPNVELFIYGHSGDQIKGWSTELYVYREKGFNPRYSLGSCMARSQNRDGVAILEVAKRVRNQTTNPVLYFVLSDGAPCAGGYGGSSAMDHVAECVGKVEKMNFHVIQVCIQHSYDPKKMFKHFVVLEDMSTLAISLGIAIKKAVMDSAKIRMT